MTDPPAPRSHADGYLNHYGRFWLRPPRGHGHHENMSGIPQKPLLAIACHEPTKGTGRCRAERIKQTFAHQWSASYLINPLLLQEWTARHFQDVANQRVPSAGMYAIAFASQLCGEVHIYGFGTPACPHQCYHYYDCGETAGNAGVQQGIMFGSGPRAVRATGGYHNFSAQAAVLQRLARSGAITADWGTCGPTTGDPPPEFRNHQATRNTKSAVQRARNTKRAVQRAKHLTRQGRTMKKALTGKPTRRKAMSRVLEQPRR